MLEDNRLIHHGLNKDYRPVGYTIDTFSQDFLVAGEYSTEKEYFHGKASKAPDGQGTSHGQDTMGENAEAPVTTYAKIEKDVQHVLDHAAGKLPQKIYLMSEARRHVLEKIDLCNTRFERLQQWFR